jgi:hypothetical protein
MESSSVLRVAFADLHKEIVRDLDGLEPRELFWQPAPGINHIGFLLWHLVRDEDVIISEAILKRAEIWRSQTWAETLGLNPAEQGTGLDSARLESLHFELSDLMGYAEQVWSQTDMAVSALADERLDEPLSWSTEWKLVNLLTTGCLAHGWVHLGEIRQLRGLLGWKYRE